jgi:methylmalonyl-CoA/ethylmalonyl-CoA epimerase
MMIQGLSFHHIGVACRDLETEARNFSFLGYTQEGLYFEDPIQKIRGFFLTGGGPRLELLAPLDETSPVIPWLQRGVKFYHQAFETPSLDESLNSLVAKRGKIVTGPVPAVAFGGLPIAFVMMPGLLLIELIQQGET